MADQAHIDPMGQFKLVDFFTGSSDIGTFTYTNQAFWMTITVLAIFVVFVVWTRGRATIPTRTQSVAEVIYQFTYKLVEDVASKEGVKYFPYIITLFLFILFSNLLGLLPGSYTATAQFAVTGILALLVFISVTVIGFAKNGIGFLKLFWVSEAPAVLRPVLALIEVVSYFVRPLSHSVRLGGNILAGHAVLKVFAGFAGLLGVYLAIVPILGISVYYALETLVACVQAYVFAILTCVYLNDALHPGH